GEAGVEPHPGGLAVDSRGNVERATVRVEGDHRHRLERGGWRTVPAGQRHTRRERRLPGGGGPQPHFLRRASAATSAAAPSSPSFSVFTTRSQFTTSWRCRPQYVRTYWSRSRPVPSPTSSTPPGFTPRRPTATPPR